MIDLGFMMTKLVDESGGGIASEWGRAQVVVFEASEGDALQDDEVKHYDADSARAWRCLGPLSGICAGVLSVSTKVIMYADSGTIVPDGAYRCSKPRYSMDSDVLDIALVS
jgi:hypothetical protein